MNVSYSSNSSHLPPEGFVPVPSLVDLTSNEI